MASRYVETEAREFQGLLMSHQARKSRFYSFKKSDGMGRAQNHNKAWEFISVFGLGHLKLHIWIWNLYNVAKSCEIYHRILTLMWSRPIQLRHIHGVCRVKSGSAKSENCVFCLRKVHERNFTLLCSFSSFLQVYVLKKRLSRLHLAIFLQKLPKVTKL